MTANKHTPGPWELHESATHVRVVAENGENIWFEDKRCPRVIEDARLIAAAPEMLEALVGAIVFLQNHLPDEALAPHRAAVYKAMGMQP